jgi:U3 small nucleolar RNA-associated protein 25
MDLDDWNSPTTKLLTLLNVSAAKSLKRKVFDQQGSPTRKQKLNKRRVEIVSPDSLPDSAAQVNDEMETTEPEVGEAEQGDSSGDVGVNEAADLSDTEGALHLLSRKCLPDWTKSLPMSGTLEPRHRCSINPRLSL